MKTETSEDQPGPTAFVVTLGSNVSDAADRVAEAARWLSEIFGSILLSDIYITRPLSGVGADYANAVASGRSSLTQTQITALLKEYESQCGRDENARRRGSVPIDIDLIFYGELCLRPAELSRSYYRIGAYQLGLPTTYH